MPSAALYFASMLLPVYRRPPELKDMPCTHYSLRYLDDPLADAT